MTYALKEAVSALRRAPMLAALSAAMIALSLLVVGLFGIAAYNIKRVLERVESRVEIVAYIKDDADFNGVKIAQSEIDKMVEVRETRYISRDQALEIAKQELPEFRSIFSGLDSNPLPASLEVSLKPGQTGPEAVKRVADHIAAFSFVEDVRYGQEWLDKVYLLRKVAGVATLVLGLAFAAVAALIIGAAVRMAVFARRDEITIMRLVGATDGFVRRPFWYEGLFTGLAGAIIAVIVTWLAYGALSKRLFQLEWLPDMWVLGIVLAGALLGAVSSSIAVRRHLKEI
ncbi:MAG TPA: permease-like cell division protein FtsX [Longimicrobiales bacterium]|nr:permease-like cell division protein FtsX [Longimicrobiales bacterium]